jgi:hypothetical protein
MQDAHNRFMKRKPTVEKGFAHVKRLVQRLLHISKPCWLYLDLKWTHIAIPNWWAFWGPIYGSIYGPMGPHGPF